jgi:dihydrofolate reductase
MAHPRRPNLRSEKNEPPFTAKHTGPCRSSGRLPDARPGGTRAAQNDSPSAGLDRARTGVLCAERRVGQALLEDGLLDELKLWVHPVVVGRGTLLFRPGEHTDLTLERVDTTSTGVVILTYRPNPT